MRSKKELERELQGIKNNLKNLASKDRDVKELITEKAKSDDSSSTLLTLVKYVMDESRTNRHLLQEIANAIGRIESDITSDYADEQEEYAANLQQDRLIKEVPISDLDRKILQTVQTIGMVSAEELKGRMGYRGRNAASARLNKLYKQGLLERYQLGHKVYYKYDAGKATNTLIVSPPQ